MSKSASAGKLNNSAFHSSLKIKDLNREVEEIMSQEESDEELKKDAVTPPQRRRRSISMELATPGSMVVRAEALQTVRRSVKMEIGTPRDSALSVDTQHALRRSTRKSVKPAQDYDEIIGTNRGLRSSSKVQHVDEVSERVEEPQPKWTPAKVGRVSKKRSRKNRKAGGEKLKLKVDGGSENTEYEKKSTPSVVSAKQDEATEQPQPLEAESDENVDAKPEKKGGLTPQIETMVKSATTTMKNEMSIIDLSENDLEDFHPLKDDDSNVAKMGEQVVRPQPKWTPEKVDRESQKRGHKSCEAKEEQLNLEVDDRSKDVEHEKEEPSSPVMFTMQNQVTEEAQPMEAEGVENVDAKPENKDDLKLQNVAMVTKTTTTMNMEIIIDLSEKDMEEFGLNPLKDDSAIDYEVEISVSQTELAKTVKQVVPTSDDNQENEQAVVETVELENKEFEENSQGGTASVADKEISINNDTFNTSECIVVECSEDKMDALQISDDESETAPFIPRIIITPTGDESMLDVAPVAPVTPRRSSKLATPSHTPMGATPKRTSKVAGRLPTPYKRKELATSDKKLMKDETEQVLDDGEKENEPVVLEKAPPVTVAVSTMEPKEIVLRSIRKRSLSMCVGPVARKQPRVVTFHSPSNQTVVIEEFDLKKKQEDGDSFVTKRRKRSMSFDESALSSATKCSRSNLCGNTPSKLRQTPQKVVPMRTKLPNFAAIHQKQFAKMENLVEHVNRKAERAKVLTNSGVKLPTASAQKHMPSKIPHMSAADKPKALKKINLDTSTKPAAAVVPSAPLSLTISHTIETVAGESKIVHLPKPQLAIIRPRNITVAPQKSPTQPTSAKKVLKPRPPFNLSTSTQSQIAKVNAAKSNVQLFTAKATAVSNTSAVHAAPTASSVPLQSFENKIATRRQRHMDMFKGRVGSAGAAGRKHGEIIRGVRSNRRFELQMQHRQNLEHN